MAKRNSDESDPCEERELWLVGELRRLCVEDDFAGALPAMDRYPHLTRHKLSEFERDMRDWGFAYGLAFGLAVAKWPGEPHAETARLAYGAALMVHIRWGEIQDPALRREAAIRAAVEQYDQWDDDRYRRQSGSTETPMGSGLASALHDLREAVA